MTNLIDRATYVQQMAGDGDVISCALYRRRHVFQTEGKLYWLVKRVAGVDGFRSLIQATHAVDENPGEYPTYDGQN